ncbi:FecR domain-containing protein [Rhodopseudomonas sp. HC1]|uniref:FecR domain-containing protein n=1 Tax=Rhodopseudomonas infernalis TaxID=2897386 RepID=UPI001EE98D68|nr:FecR domain-containing protein [Rhodopseudomonas infernalis]MCG6203382.1 FecR domain-containing protein [Rhodopseudomonas infernalis]
MTKAVVSVGRSAFAALIVALLGSSALAQEVGKASAVNPNATANMRTIAIGSSITHKERIQTTSAGSVQLLFVDKTSMTIGPNSDLTIDEYVYDPNAGRGKLAATLGKGALRFVGGQISHSGDAEIKTASATVGIRGGVALIGVGHVYAGYGALTVSAGGTTVSLGAGEYTALQPGQGPSPPGPPPPNFVLSQIQLFQSGSGQSGGVARGTASPANVRRAEARATGTPGGSVAGSLTPSPPPPPPPPPVASTLTQTIQTSTQQAAVQQQIDQRPTPNPPPPPPPPPDPRPSLSLSGFVTGLMRTFVNDSESGPSTGLIGGTATVALDGTSGRMQANFNGQVAHPPDSAYLPSDFSYQFGSTDPALDPQSVYADYNNFGGSAAHDKTGKPLSTINGMAITNHTAAMITVTPETARMLSAESGSTATTFCECDYTRWGLWTSQSTQGPYLDNALGFWVAGRPTTVAEVPTYGVATYNGHVIANIDNNGANYVASADFSNTVNFGSRTGQVTVTGLDSTNYVGQVQFMQDPRNFVGSLAGNTGDRQMALTGSFFRGVSSPVGEMGGAVALTGTNYLGSGIFAAKMK